jgi:hypothetical protein
MAELLWVLIAILAAVAAPFIFMGIMVLIPLFIVLVFLVSVLLMIAVFWVLASLVMGVYWVGETLWGWGVAVIDRIESALDWMAGKILG